MRKTVGTAIAAAAALGLLLAVVPVHAETALAVRTKAVEITLDIDDAFKDVPGLFENCLAEGTAWATKNRADADAAYRDSPGDFRDGQRWTFERRYERESAPGRYVSLLRRDAFYTGGAHPNTYVDTILWDRDGNKRVSVRPLFRETAANGPTMTALAQLIRAAVAAEKKARGVEVAADLAKDEWLQPIKPDLLKLGPLGLARSSEDGKSGGLAVHFSPYAVGSYAEGEYTVIIPWRAFASYLSSEGRAVFGGEAVQPRKAD